MPGTTEAVRCNRAPSRLGAPPSAWATGSVPAVHGSTAHRPSTAAFPPDHRGRSTSQPACHLCSSCCLLIEISARAFRTTLDTVVNRDMLRRQCVRRTASRVIQRRRFEATRTSTWSISTPTSLRKRLMVVAA